MMKLENFKILALAVTIVVGLMAANVDKGNRLGKVEPVLQPVPVVQTWELTG